MTSEIKKPLTGQCLCGAVKYEVDQIEPQMGHCHCSMCRKFHGAAFATYGEADIENFRWIQGEACLKDFIAENGTRRRFCTNCGSSMTFAPTTDDQTVVEFALGTLDGDIELRPDVHIFVSSKANWLEISDELPQFEAGRQSKRL